MLSGLFALAIRDGVARLLPVGRHTDTAEQNHTVAAIVSHHKGCHTIPGASQNRRVPAGGMLAWASLLLRRARSVTGRWADRQSTTCGCPTNAATARSRHERPSNTRHRSTSTPLRRGDAGAVCSAMTEPGGARLRTWARAAAMTLRAASASSAVRVAANAMRSLMPGPNPGLAERSKSP